MQHQYKPVGLLLVSYIPHWLNLVSDPLPYIVDHKRELKRKDLERHSGCSGGGGRGQIYRESFARDLRCFCKYALSLWARGGTEGRGGNKLVREMPRLRICTGSTFEGAPPSILATVATSSIGHFMRCCRSHHQCEPSTVHCWQKGEDCILQKICDLLWVAAGNVTCRTCRASPALCNPLPHNIITRSHYWRHQRPWKQYQNSNIIAFEGKRFSMFNHSFHRIHRSSSALHLCDVSWQETCETCGNISRKGNCSAEFQ